MSLMSRIDLTKLTSDFDRFQEQSWTNGDMIVFQQRAADQFKESASAPDSATVMYLALALNEEAGEVAGKVKKAFRDDNGEFTLERLESLKKELGDVLWYTAVLAKRLGFTLSEVAQENIKKCTEREQRGTLRGSGDDR